MADHLTLVERQLLYRLNKKGKSKAEIAEDRQLAQRLNLETYFALPYRSWQRGSNENTNGLLRQFFPKSTDFSRISHQEVAGVEELLNERPRRRLGCRSPAEILSKRLCRS